MRHILLHGGKAPQASVIVYLQIPQAKARLAEEEAIFIAGLCSLMLNWLPRVLAAACLLRTFKVLILCALVGKARIIFEALTLLGLHDEMWRPPRKTNTYVGQARSRAGYVMLGQGVETRLDQDI